MRILKNTDSHRKLYADQPVDVAFFELAGWSKKRAMAPAFIVGGFPPPRYTGGGVLVMRDVFDFPPAGGHVEVVGRNAYLNGCSASLLVCPPSLGNPCVNHLHLIPEIVQDEHTHPSDRWGLMVRGKVRAYHEGGYLDLKRGDAWHLPAHERHHFVTGSEPTDILVFHPDSAWGPTDKSHQMLDATILVD